MQEQTNNFYRGRYTNRYCPECGKPRLDVLPLFCDKECQDKYKEWIKSGSEIKIVEFAKNALKDNI